MKTLIQKSQSFLLIKCIKTILFLLSTLVIQQEITAQTSNCLPAPQAATFQPLFTFLNANTTNMVTATIWEFESTSLTLDEISIGNNMLRLRRVGSINYLKADVVGNSCLRQRTISMRRILDGSLQNINVSMSLALGGGLGGLPITQETILFNNITYTRIQTIGTGATRTHLFRNTSTTNRFIMIDFQN